jgi:hypothetical protein
MRIGRNLFAAALTLSLGACMVPVQRELLPVGGSRTEGIVTLSYEHGAMLDPQVDYAAAQARAGERCKAWGYSGAQAFGGETRRCRDRACTGYIVTVPYQCTGAPASR